MKKKDIIQLVKKLVKEDAYGSATLTTQGAPRTRAVAPAGKDPYTGRVEYPYTVGAKTKNGMMEAGPSNNPYYNAIEAKAKKMGMTASDYMKDLLKDKSEMEIVKMGYQDLAALAGVENLDESQGTLASDMLNYADHIHMELVDTMQGVSTHPDKRTDGFYIKFPHENGPEGRGAMFGKETADQIERSKAQAKLAAIKTKQKFQGQIEDFKISTNKSGVYGNVWLWIMPSKQVSENKTKNKMKKLKEADVSGLEKAAIEAEKKAIEMKIKALNDKKAKMATGTDSVVESEHEGDSFGSAGTDKRTQQVITDTLQLIRRSGDATLAMDVMEGIGKEFKIKGCVGEFEFSGGAPDPNDGLPKMDPDNWGFKQAGEEAGMDMRGL